MGFVWFEIGSVFGELGGTAPTPPPPPLPHQELLGVTPTQKETFIEWLLATSPRVPLKEVIKWFPAQLAFLSYA